jgi:hypothetical protein
MKRSSGRSAVPAVLSAGNPAIFEGETCGWGMASAVRSARTVNELAYIVNVVSYFVKKVA